MKVMKRSFGLIMTISITSLIILIALVFFLTRGNKTTFQNSGYIISFEKGTTVIDRFDEGTEYRENINGELVFNNTEDKKAVSSLDNFIHYKNGDIAYLQNGVILDLSKINETIIPYYNITNKSLIEKGNNEYIIKTINGELNLSNWLGKISENKYIISGEKLTLKLAGNSDILYSSENFFEFNYIENGVVVISDGVNTRSATADGTYFYIGENTVINLGDKNIYFNNEEKVSLEQITINGDENIDIIPPEEDKEPENPADGNNQDGDNNQGGNTGEGDGNNQGQTGGDDNENPGGEDKPEEPEVTITKNPQFKLLEANVTANKMDLLIAVIDNYDVITGDLNISITNMKTAKTVYTDTVSGDSSTIEISTMTGILEPDTNYIVSIVGNYQTDELTYERQYFQRVFRTETLGLDLKKDYASTSELSFLVLMDDNTYVNSFDLELYDNNNELVETKNIEAKDQKEVYVLFEGLNSNTSYTGVLRNVMYGSIIYSDVNNEGSYREDGSYTLALSLKTLKKAPILESLEATVNKEENSAKLTIGNINDPDNGLTKFTYKIYEYSDVTEEGGSEPVKIIETKDAKSVDVPIDGNELKSNQSYRFNVVLEYYDNEKTVEIESMFSNSFVSGAVPAIRYEINSEKTNFRTISGTIYIEDKNCTVPIEGRECFPEINELYIRYYKASNSTIEYNYQNIEFDPITLSSNFEITNLVANTDYVFELFGDVNLKDGNGLQEDVQIGEGFTVKTAEIVPLTVNWGEEKISNEDNVFSLGGNQLASTNNSEIEALNLANLKIEVYASNTDKLEDGKLIGEKVFNTNIKSDFYDNKFKITAKETFGYTIDDLKKKTDGILTKYYIFKITDATDNAGINVIPVENNIYAFKIDDTLIADDILGDPTITAKRNGSLVEIVADFDYNNLNVLFPESDIKLVLGVCNTITNECHDFSPVGVTSGKYTRNIFHTNGTDYNEKDILLKDGNITLNRGNTFKFRFYVTVDSDKDGTIDYYYPGRTEKKYVDSSPLKLEKDKPDFKLNVVSSTEDSITYSFRMQDFDKTLYKEADEDKYYINYRVGTEEYKVEFENNTDTEFTISGLTNNTRYDIYYKIATVKTGNVDSDVSVDIENKYTFDGFYKEEDFNIEYSITNNQISNKVVVKILPTGNINSVLKRISAFQVLIKDGDSIKYDKTFTNFKECSDSSCVLYKEIKYAEIENFNNRNLTVEVNAIYDNGLIGNTSDIGYLVQQNSNESGQGSYLVLDSQSKLIEATSMPGVYYYQMSGNNATLYNLIDRSNKLYTFDEVPDNENKLFNTRITLAKTYEGMKYGNYTITFKSLSKTSVKPVGDTNFIFYSITPDVSTTYDGVINGVDITIDTTGITSNMLSRGFIKEDNKYYIYLELYNNETDELIKTYKKEITVENGYAKETIFNIYNLDDATTYKYKLFAKLDKNGEAYTQLNDIDTCNQGECRPVEYSFTSLRGSELFGNITYNHLSESTEIKYLNRKISFDLTLNNELVNYGKNYDLLINLWENDEIIGTETITNDQIIDNANVKFEFDITNSIDAIYGADYFRLELIAITDTTKEDEYVEIYNNFLVLNELKQPETTISKMSNLVDGVYSIEVGVGIKDSDKVITNGVYTVRLLTNETKTEVAKAENLSVDELKMIKFASSVDNPDKYNIQVDLVPDIKYIIEVSYEIYTNNFSLRQEADLNGQPVDNYIRKTITTNYEVYTTGPSGVSLGSVSGALGTDNIKMTFKNSSNLEKIVSMKYEIYKLSDKVAEGTYKIGEGQENNFVKIDNGTDTLEHEFVISPENITFDLNSLYEVYFTFNVLGEDGSEVPVSTSNNYIEVKGNK